MKRVIIYNKDETIGVALSQEDSEMLMQYFKSAKQIHHAKFQIAIWRDIE